MADLRALQEKAKEVKKIIPMRYSWYIHQSPLQHYQMNRSHRSRVLMPFYSSHRETSRI